MKKFAFMAGAPRSGSTLLSAILSQNPRIHSEGMSGVCQIMWDTHVSTTESCREHLVGSNRQTIGYEIVSAIPHLYYSNVEKPLVIDKCRTWTFPPNLEMLKTYVTSEPKIIVLTRPFKEIVESFRSLYVSNGYEFPEERFTAPRSKPITHALDGIDWAMSSGEKCFLFVEYKDLVEDTVNQLTRIYDFLEEKIYVHDLENIINKTPENDEFYGLRGMHDVRKTVGYRKENNEKQPH